MTTNVQLNDTHCYHIKPTNSTCNMISSKSPVLVGAWQTFFVSAVKFYQWKIFW